jgi:hypothetical protein
MLENSEEGSAHQLLVGNRELAQTHCMRLFLFFCYGGQRLLFGTPSDAPEQKKYSAACGFERSSLMCATCTNLGSLCRMHLMLCVCASHTVPPPPWPDNSGEVATMVLV